MKKKYIFILITSAIVLLIFSICNLPWPTRMDLSMNAAVVTADGEVIQEGTLEMQGRILDYLFKQDTLQFTSVNILGSEVSTEKSQLPDTPILAIDEEYNTVHISFYLIKEKTVVNARIALAKDQPWCFLRLEDGLATESTPVFIAASGSDEFSIEDILGTCKSMID